MTDVSLRTACESLQAYADSPERICNLDKGSLPILQFNSKLDRGASLIPE